METHDVLFKGWDHLVRVGASALLGYLVLVVVLRIAGNRATSKMSNFDWAVTVALGSILGSTIVVEDVVVAEMAVAVGVLVGLQAAMTWIAVRSRGFETVLKASPTLLVHRGEFVEHAMRRERVSRRDILAAIRESGIVQLRDVRAVVLESDASLSVMAESGRDDAASSPGDERVLPAAS